MDWGVIEAQVGVFQSVIRAGTIQSQTSGDLCWIMR